MKDLLEELTTTTVYDLSPEAKNLFYKIMEVLDERDELQRKITVLKQYLEERKAKINPNNKPIKVIFAMNDENIAVEIELINYILAYMERNGL